MGVFGPNLLTGGGSFWADLPEIVLALAGSALIIAFIAVMGLVGRVLYGPAVPWRELRGAGLPRRKTTKGS